MQWLTQLTHVVQPLERLSDTELLCGNISAEERIAVSSESEGYLTRSD